MYLNLKIPLGNKVSGHDQIINEFLINVKDTPISIIYRLLNVILQSDIVPDDWCMGYISSPLLKIGVIYNTDF